MGVGIVVRRRRILIIDLINNIESYQESTRSIWNYNEIMMMVI